MKKTYQQPCTQTVQVETQQMIAGSVEPETLGKKGGNSIGDDYDASRGSGSWDDEY